MFLTTFFKNVHAREKNYHYECSLAAIPIQYLLHQNILEIHYINVSKKTKDSNKIRDESAARV